MPDIFKVIQEIFIQDQNNSCASKFMNSNALYMPSNGDLNSQIFETDKISNRISKVFVKVEECIANRIHEYIAESEFLTDMNVLPKLDELTMENDLSYFGESSPSPLSRRKSGFTSKPLNDFEDSIQSPNSRAWFSPKAKRSSVSITSDIRRSERSNTSK